MHRYESYLLDVVVAESSAVLELLSGEDQSLLVRWDAFLILDLGLDIVDGVGRLHLEGDSLAREGLDEAIRKPQVSSTSFLLSVTVSRVRWRSRFRWATVSLCEG